MKSFSIAIAGCLIAISHAASLDLDISNWEMQNYDLSEHQYDVINIFGEGSVNIDTLYASDNGTQLNIRDGATVHLNDIVISNGPVGINLEGGTFDFAIAPTITIILNHADLSTEGELCFPAFYYNSEQLDGDWMANFNIVNSLFASSFSFVTTDFSPYGFMENVDLEMDLQGGEDMNLNIPTGSALYTVKATNTKVVPEPTTATLSILALAGLAARRRRR